MAELPRVTENDFVERRGIIAVDAAVNQARCIWREVLQRDIGIDGHIEYVTDQGLATGRIVAVQVKSGASRFATAGATHVAFTPKEKHRSYWVEHPLPVILILHNPGDGETIWTDARGALRGQGAPTTVQVPRSNRLDQGGVLDCLQVDGPLPAGDYDPMAVLAEMATPSPAAQGLTFLYLFAQGLTDITECVFFSSGLMTDILDVLSADWDPPSYGFGPAEHAFSDAYVDFLVAHDLARVDYDSYHRSAVERQMTGKFLVPLTSKGLAVRDLINQFDYQLLRDPDLSAVAVRERFVEMVVNPTGYDEFASRQRRLVAVRAAIASAADEATEP